MLARIARRRLRNDRKASSGSSQPLAENWRDEGLRNGQRSVSVWCLAPFTAAASSSIDSRGHFDGRPHQRGGRGDDPPRVARRHSSSSSRTPGANNAPANRLVADGAVVSRGGSSDPPPMTSLASVCQRVGVVSRGVTEVSPRCHRGVTKVSPRCHRGVTRCREVSRTRCHEGVTRCHEVSR